MKIFYITRARIPSEKAHGFQIVTMCKTFSEMGNEVTLILPKRNNPIKENLWQYFDLRKNFQVRYLYASPVLFGSALGKMSFQLEGITFAIRSLFLKFPSEGFVFTRSLEVAFFHAVIRRKVVFEIHDWPHSASKLFVFVLRRVPFLIVTAKGLAEELELNGIKHYLVAPNGVGEEYFNPLSISNITKESFKIDLDKKILMYVGSLAKWKGVRTLLKASEHLDANRYQIVIAGGSENEVSVLENEFPRVKFVGYIPNSKLPSFQKLADILIIPNRNDSDVSSRYTSPLKLFAHMASKCPIIISDLPSTRSIVNDSEVFFFDGSTEGLCRAVESIENDANLAKQKADKSYAKAFKMTWKKRVESILSFVA